VKKIVLIFLMFTFSLVNAETISYLTDIRAVYFYEQSDNIDWPAVYYLGAENGCQVDLVSVLPGPGYQKLVNETNEYNLRSFRFLLPDVSNTTLRKMMNDLFGETPPDVIIFDAEYSGKEMKSLGQYIFNAESDSAYGIAAKKIYQRFVDYSEIDIHINSRQYYTKYFTAMANMAHAIKLNSPSGALNSYTHYKMMFNSVGREGDKPSFISGLKRFKFGEIVERHIGMVLPLSELGRSQEEYLKNLKEISDKSGDKRIEALISARSDLIKFKLILKKEYGGEKYPILLGEYINTRLGALSKSILSEIGVDFSARAEIYNSSEGKRLKIKTELTNGGLRELYTGWIGFHTKRNMLKMVDSNWIKIRPRGTIIKEYPVSIDPRKLENIDLETILFVGQVKYENSIIEFEYIAEGRAQESFSLEIIPDFLILKPFDKSRVDKLVSLTDVKLIFNKPVDYSGLAKIDIRTPQFVKAGAFEHEINLRKGERSMELTIPIVATKSLPKRLHEISFNIMADNKALASDIVYLRQSNFSLAKVNGIALFPDNEGLLEDIMIAGGAEYRVISDRLVKAGDFNLYSLLVFGTRFYEKYSSSDLIRDKVKKYLENGGTVVVFGQPDDWDGRQLPVSIIPSANNIDAGDVSIVDKDNRLFKIRDLVRPESFKNQISKHYPSFPAIVYPGKNIYSWGGRSLLSETKVGRGKLIYCGLPLLSMFRDLKPEAINLLTNIMSSSR